MHRRNRLRESRRVLVLALGLALLASNAVALPASAATPAGWNTANTLPAPLNRPVALTDGSFFYVAGGSNGGPSKAVWSAPVSNTGVLGPTWTTQPNLPMGLNKHAGVLQSGFAFILGGQSTGAVAQSAVYAAAVNSTTGTVGAWSKTTALPAAVYEAGAVASGGYVWNLGGFNAAGTGQATVNVAKQTNGTLGNWTPLTTTPLPTGEGELGATIANGWIYVVGGHTIDGPGNGQKNVYAAQISANGALGAWQTLTALPAIRWDMGVTAAGGYLWAIGGYNSAALATNTTYRAPLNADGSIGTWQALTPMPGTMAETSLSTAQGYLFEAGSKTASGGSNAIYTAPVAGPWVMLSSYAVMGGASVTVSGTGFAAGEPVSVAFDGSTEGSTTADSTGSFGLPSGGVTFTVPSGTATGSYLVTATGQTSGLQSQVALAVSGSGGTPTPTPTATATSTATATPTPTFTPSPTPTPPPPTGDTWTQYLNGMSHQGYNSVFNAFGPSNAINVKQKWPTAGTNTGNVTVTNPVIANVAGGVGKCTGQIIAYEGDWNGNLYAFDANSGKQCWRTYLAKDVNPNPTSLCTTTIGITSTPTVATIMINGTATQVVFAGGSDLMFAVNAQNGQQIWAKALAGVPVNTYSTTNIWSSPTYWAANNWLYASTASNCDEVSPIDGTVYRLDPATGDILAQQAMLPNNTPGAGVWGSPTLDPNAGPNGTIYVATGNTYSNGVQACTTSIPLACAVIALDANTLALRSPTSYWQIPFSQFVADGDFGDTPVLFPGANGNTWLAVGNKNGHFYVLDTTNLAAGPLVGWDMKLSNGGGNPIKGIIAPASYYPGSITNNVTGTTCANGVLFVAAGNTTLNGTAYAGSYSAWCVGTTPKLLWQQGTQGLVWAAPTLANGLLADQSGQNVELRDWSTGTLLKRFATGGNVEDAPTFANGMLYAGSNKHALYAFWLPPFIITWGGPRAPTPTPCTAIGCPPARFEPQS